MRLPAEAHTSRPWRIHEITLDFRLYDVWASPTPSGLDDFPRLVRQFAVGDTATNPSRLACTLFAIRWKLGAVLGWDDPHSGVGSRPSILRDRLPADLRDGPGRSRVRHAPLPLGLPGGQRVAAKMATRTVHGVMHIGWVPDDAGGYRDQVDEAEVDHAPPRRRVGAQNVRFMRHSAAPGAYPGRENIAISRVVGSLPGPLGPLVIFGTRMNNG